MAGPADPETPPVPQASPGRVPWRRRVTIGLAGLAGLAAAAHGLGIPFAYAAAGAGTLGAAGYGMRHYPAWVRHWNPLGRPRDKDYRNRGQQGFSEKWKANWKRSSPLKAPGSLFRSRPRAASRTGRGAGFTRRGSGQAAHRSRFPGFRRRSRAALPSSGRRGAGSGLRRAFRPGRGTGTGSRRRSGAFRGLRRGSGGFRRGSGGSRGPSRRFPGFRRGRPAIPAGRRRTGAGARTSRGRGRASRRRPGTGTPGGGGARGGARTSRGRWRPFRRRPASTRRPGGRRPATGSPRKQRPRRRLTRPLTWFRRRRLPARLPEEDLRAWTLRGWMPFRKTRARWARWRRTAPARRQARRAHRHRIRRLRAKLNRVAPRCRWRPWKRISPVWRHRARRQRFRAWFRRNRAVSRLRAWFRRNRAVSRFRRNRAVSWFRRNRAVSRLRAWFRRNRAVRRHRSWRRLLRRQPRPQAPRGTRWQRQLDRFDQWRHARWRKRLLGRVFRRRRPAPPVPVPVPVPRTAPPPPRPARIPLPQQAQSGNGTSPRGGHAMATSAQVADGIRDLDVDFDDAETLHQVLMHLHEVTEATREVFERLAEKVKETGLKEKYGETIEEAAGSLSGIGDQVQEVVGGGVLQG